MEQTSLLGPTEAPSRTEKGHRRKRNKIYSTLITQNEEERIKRNASSHSSFKKKEGGGGK